MPAEIRAGPLEPLLQGGDIDRAAADAGHQLVGGDLVAGDVEGQGLDAVIDGQVGRPRRTRRAPACCGWAR
jgi:hypothetical protein